jgi:ADP-ribosylglycohydrolase
MTTEDRSLRARAQGAMVGLAVGDAAGFPSLFHRTIRMGWRRSVLWRFAGQLDEQRVLRFPLPFTLGRPDGLFISGTDDSEFAAVAAIILLEADGDYSSETLFAGWQKHVVQPSDDIWSGIAERASILNARLGLRPPETGGDNPAHFDDGAVCRAVAVGVRFAGRPEQAADVARNLAEITHAEDGVWAAEAMAATISSAVGGSGLPEAVESGRQRIPADCWLARQLVGALRLAEQAASPFDLAAELSDQVANASYSFGTVAPETLASADGDPMTAIPAATTIAKQADSVPAMVGAVTGAVAGIDRLPAAWRSRVATLRGVCVPRLEGVSLGDLADELIAGAGP